MTEQLDSSNDQLNSSARSVLQLIESASREVLLEYVFQPNDARTWASVRSAISNLLTGMWKEGKLIGAKPADAFSVACGIGSTMTAGDILEGRLIVLIEAAVVHPAEFVSITLQETMLGAE